MRQARAVAKEEYEEAAQLRDEVRALAVQLAAREKAEAHGGGTGDAPADVQAAAEGGEA